MSNKAKVLEKYPKAFCLRGPFDPWWRVYKATVYTHDRLGEGSTPAAAWQAAAESITKGSDK